MPQLDIVTFFNQVIWLTVVFVLLVTSFYTFLVRPYNYLFMVREVLISAFVSLKAFNSDTGCFPRVNWGLRWFVCPDRAVRAGSFMYACRAFFAQTIKKITSVRKNLWVLFAAAILFEQ